MAVSIFSSELVHKCRKAAMLLTVSTVLFEFYLPGRQRRWFKIDDAIAELSVHKPLQCKYVRLLSEKANQTTSATIAPSSHENNNNTQ